MATENKTEQATPKKRRDERKKGNIFQSRDIVNAFYILAIFYTLKIFFPFIYDTLAKILMKYVTYIKEFDEITQNSAIIILKDCAVTILFAAGPVMLVSIAISIILSGVQTRFLISRENIKMKFSRISPLQGIKKIISIRSFVELLKSILKVVIIGYVFYSQFQFITQNAIKLTAVDIMQAIYFILDAIMGVVIKLSLIFMGIAFFDYFYQRWEYEKNIKMTKQEVKEEYKQTEGDPQIKSKIKETQRKMAMNRMMQQVPKADVIIRNPTHFAVALKYTVELNSAPIVVAKGQDHVALKIIEIAENNKVPIMSNKPLARSIYAEVEINHEIPPEFYSVMAEVMAWVYSLKMER